MATKYTARIPTVQYGYIEVEAATWAELTEGCVNVQDGGAGLFGDATDQAIQNLQDQGVASTNPGLQPGGYQPSTQAQQATQQAAAPVRQCAHGARTRYAGNGARGPYVAWFCPLPKGTVGQCKPEFE